MNVVGASCIAVDTMMEEGSGGKRKPGKKVAFRLRPGSGLVSRHASRPCFRRRDNREWSEVIYMVTGTYRTVYVGSAPHS